MLGVEKCPVDTTTQSKSSLVAASVVWSWEVTVKPSPEADRLTPRTAWLNRILSRMPLRSARPMM